MPFNHSKVEPIIGFFIQLRIERRFSQEAVSQRTGIALSTYQRIEQFKRDPRLSEVHALCELYGITWLDLSWAQLNKRHLENSDLVSSLHQIPAHIRGPLLELVRAVSVGG